MTNGVFEIQHGKQVIKLMLGFNASAEFEKRYYQHISSGVVPGEGILFTDLVYAGMYCQAVKTGSLIPKYENVFQLVETLSESEDFNDIRNSLWLTYYESKWGQDFQNRVQDFLKKKVEEKNQSQ